MQGNETKMDASSIRELGAELFEALCTRSTVPPLSNLTVSQNPLRRSDTW
ncbi:hypothetical protein PSAC2689_60213 [Paraburkholderia sacchari]